MYEILEPNFPNFDSVYESIHIAELIYGKDSDEPLDGLAFWESMSPQGFQDAGPEILGRLEVTLRPEVVPYWWNNIYMEFVSDEKPVYFLHYAASWGCYHFCRARLKLGGDACTSTFINLAGQDSRTSLLVAAISDDSMQRTCPRFGVELLRKRVDVDALVDAISDGVPTKLPAWLIAYVRTAEKLLPQVAPRTWTRLSAPEGEHAWLELLGELHAYSLEIDQPLTLKVEVLIPTLARDHTDHAGNDQHIFGKKSRDQPYEVLNIESEDYIRLMTPFENAIKRHKPPLSPSSWPEGLSAQDFLGHASERRWNHNYTSPILDNPTYNIKALSFALLAIDWGKNHLSLRPPGRTQQRMKDELMNFRVY